MFSAFNLLQSKNSLCGWLHDGGEIALTLSEPAFLGVSHEPGGGVHINPPFYFSPETSEELVLNMTIVGYPLKIFLRYITFL